MFYKKMILLFSLVDSLASGNALALTILVDPGHGGEEDGAVVQTVGEKIPRIIKEKDLTLAISKKIHDKLKNKKYRVYLTRSVDRTVTLAQRAEIAEKTKADLFISVHINSSTEPNVSGFETYYLDNHNDVAVEKVEKTENLDKSGDNSIVQQILVDLVVSQTVQTSKPLARMIDQELKAGLVGQFKIPSRGVRPGLFYVLALSKRPGVLLEVGFLSTLKDRKKLMDEKFQDAYASAVVSGIEKYIKGNSKGTR